MIDRYTWTINVVWIIIRNDSNNTHECCAVELNSEALINIR